MSISGIWKCGGCSSRISRHWPPVVKSFCLKLISIYRHLISTSWQELMHFFITWWKRTLKPPIICHMKMELTVNKSIMYAKKLWVIFLHHQNHVCNSWFSCAVILSEVGIWRFEFDFYVTYMKSNGMSLVCQWRKWPDMDGSYEYTE